MSPLTVPVSSSAGTRSYCRWLDAQSAMCPPRMCSSRLYTHQSSPLGRPVSLLCPRSNLALCVRKTGNIEQDEKGLVFQNGILNWPNIFLIYLLCCCHNVTLSKHALHTEKAWFQASQTWTETWLYTRSINVLLFKLSAVYRYKTQARLHLSVIFFCY